MYVYLQSFNGLLTKYLSSILKEVIYRPRENLNTKKVTANWQLEEGRRV